MPAVMLLGLASGWLPFVLDESSARASNPSSTGVQEQGDGLMRNVEEMLAHGGMGDRGPGLCEGRRYRPSQGAGPPGD